MQAHQIHINELPVQVKLTDASRQQPLFMLLNITPHKREELLARFAAALQTCSRKWLWHNRGRAHGMRNEVERLSRGRRPAPLDKLAEAEITISITDNEF